MTQTVRIEKEPVVSTTLALIETKNALELFSNNALDPILDQIEQEARSIHLDISTEKGRKEIASLAYKIAQSKTTLDKLGKELAAGWREQTKKVDAERSKAWDRLEALQKEIRAPLTEWENKEKKRREDHEDELIVLNQCAKYAELNNLPVTEIKALMEKANELYDRDWQEFRNRAETTKNDVDTRLRVTLAQRQQYDAEKAELERLRREEADRKQREHEERLQKEAAAKAKAEAEAEAKRIADAEAARVKAQQEKAERERLRIQRDKEAAERAAAEAEARARKAEEDRVAAIAKAEADRKAAEEKAERARIAAEEDRKVAEAKAERDRKDAAEKARQDALEADEKAKRDAEAAVIAERERVEAERRKEQEATAKREADAKHRAKINNHAMDAINEIIEAFAATGNSPSKAIIEAIARGKIPHITISY